MAPEHPFHPGARRQRAIIATAFAALALVILGWVFFRTQVMEGSAHLLRAEGNRLQLIPVPAPRGAVYDRNGKLIAETIVTHDLLLDPVSEEVARAFLERVRGPLALSDSAVARVLARRRPGQPLRIAEGLGFPELSWIEAHRGELGPIALQPRPRRRYPQGEAVAHLIGFVGEIGAAEMADTARWAGYRSGQFIGRAGIEQQYERSLSGTPGARYVEVDARGRVVGSRADHESEPPIHGTDLRLTLDLDLQRYVHDIFPEGRNGAIVALLPRTGEIVALYSGPTFDPNLLVGETAPQARTGLGADPRQPMLNRAIAARHAPGSAWMLATALIGLEKGVVTPDTRMPIPCTGGMSYAGRYLRCSKRDGHGAVDLTGAIESACNVYFYQLGIWLGLNRLGAEGARLGFARPTGVDLPGEVSGTLPEGEDAYRQRFGASPTPAEVMSLAIGQGPNAQTPLRMAQFFAALANDGAAPRPRLLSEGAASAAPETDLRVDADGLRAVRAGLVRVPVPDASGQGRWQLSGMAGRAENAEDAERPHAWFTGFAGPPDGEARVVVAVMLEGAGDGARIAAPLAARVAGFYLDR